VSDTPALALPPDFRERILRVFPQDGAAWLERLPSLLAEYAARWELELGPPFELSYHYVAPAVRGDGTRAVLKLGVPDAERACEIATLRAYAGDGAVHVLEADDEDGAALLERAEPGDMLSTIEDDDERTRIAAGVMRRLFRPPPAFPLPTIADWSQAFGRLRARFGGGTGPLLARLVERAEAISREMDGAAPPVLLHGDLHHFNILRATREPWLAIDPHGVVGDPACEAGSLLLNPLYDPANVGRIDRRLDILADALAIDRQRLIAWSLHKAVLSACWTIEGEGDDYGWAVAVAEALADRI